MGSVPYSYIAFIDEAGDSGLQRIRPIDPVGASEWLTIGAIVIEAAKEAAPVEWVRSILKSIGLDRNGQLHYRELSEWRKPLVCESLSKLELSAFVVTSNKKNMRRHSNPRAAARSSGLHPNDWFYNYCVRLVLERITDLCLRHSLRCYGEPRRAQVIISSRGGHSAAHLRVYLDTLKQQSRSGTTWLKKRTIKWQIVDWALTTIQPTNLVAGLQLADVVASSFFQSVDILPPTLWNCHNAKLLKPCIARECGFHEDYGIVFQPTPYERAELVAKQREIFEFYGFDCREFDGWGPQK